jgi:hypothetical protein
MKGRGVIGKGVEDGAKERTDVLWVRALSSGFSSALDSAD